MQRVVLLCFYVLLNRLFTKNRNVQPREGRGLKFEMDFYFSGSLQALQSCSFSVRILSLLFNNMSGPTLEKLADCSSSKFFCLTAQTKFHGFHNFNVGIELLASNILG